MKYLVKFFVVTFFLLVCTHSFAEQKIVVLDLTYILNNSKAGKGAQEFMKKTFDNNTKKFSDIEKSLKKGESDLLAKKNILSKEEYGKKMNLLRKKNMDYQTERRSAIDKITAYRTKARAKLLEKIKPIVETYIKENNISLVVDKKYILGGGEGTDITKVVVEKLNKDLPSLNLK
jgi:outer membrane protein|tara:strand:+ start:4726 stop:5250 length:525 start_codon:yes stop_codon:yes gene_type:complete